MRGVQRLAPFLLVACCAAAETKPDPGRMERLLRRAVILDLHADTTQMIADVAMTPRAAS